MKITKKYCAELLDRYVMEGEVADGSDAIDASLLKTVLNEADQNSRFRVSYAPQNYSDDEDTWDLIGPGVSYGRVYYEDRANAEKDRDSLNSILREHFGPNKRAVLYSPDSYRARCLLDEACCPVCGSNKVDLEDHAFKGSVCVFRRGCGDCNSEWNDVFALQGYQDLRID